MTKRLITSILACGVVGYTAAGLTSIGSAASAAPVAQNAAATEEVRFNDLDLSRPRDKATLKHRVARAAEHVCEGIDWDTPGQPTVVDWTCYQAALKSAMFKVDRAVARANYTATLAVASQR